MTCGRNPRPRPLTSTEREALRVAREEDERRWKAIMADRRSRDAASKAKRKARQHAQKQARRAQRQ